MGYTFTRTHTCFFGEESLAPLLRAAAELRADYIGRKPYISEGAQKAMESRLDVLNAVVKLLGEPVSESLRGSPSAPARWA